MWRLARQVGLQLRHSTHQSSPPSTFVSSSATEGPGEHSLGGKIPRALRAPSRRVWRVDFGVMEWGVMRAAIPLGCCAVGVVEG